MKKTVYAADKHSSYGMSFESVYDSLHELKNAIIQHEHGVLNDNREQIPYSEELAKKCIEEGRYVLYEVELHNEECIVFDEYDGQSEFRIEKKVKNIVSTITQISI